MPSALLPRPQRAVTPTSLAQLADLTGADRPRPGEVTVRGVTTASDRVVAGDLFAALPGSKTHGVGYAAQARAAGAVAVLTDRAGLAQLPGDLAALVVDDPRSVVGAVADVVYGQPSRRLSVIGVTGTSGKTTTSFLAHAGLAAAGRSAGMIGTVGTFVGDEQLQTGFTTPEAPDLQALLAVMAERGVGDVVMEVSSHGLALGRVNGTRFVAAGFTNLSMEHLDFHPTMADYFAAKARLFDRWAQQARIVVDDDWGRRLATQAVAESVNTVSTQGGPADWRAEDVVTAADGSTTFVAHGPRGRVTSGSRIPGGFNVANALLALALLDAIDVPLEAAGPAIAAAQVPGRMERVECGQPFLAIVDYAHKPAAVEAVLHTLRSLTVGRLITVLGCGGDRDRAKRAVMGQVAARDSDLLIVTDDNPRSEDPATIRAAMLAGAERVTGAQVQEIGDRTAAIAAAVRAASVGDTVLVAGKGHEPGQEISGVVHPFDDRAQLRAALSDGPR